MIRRAALALVTVLLLGSVAGCGAGVHAEHGRLYVALGDSYTAAPGIGHAAGERACFRSRNNYPHLVAEHTGLTLIDESCSGAATTSITGRQLTLLHTWRDPQVDAVTSATDVVTLGIGGNDFALYSLISATCPGLAVHDPHGRPCTKANKEAPPGKDLAARLRKIQHRITGVVRVIKEEAPHARVLLVGYPEFVAAHGTCPGLPLATGDVPFAHRINVGLNKALSGAARATGTTYVDVYSRTRGHDICSKHPWIADAKGSGGKAAPWHPFAIEQRAVARAVEAALAS